ncbi:snoRNA-binding rRNA-processing protein imp4, partial [Mortierella alpina]
IRRQTRLRREYLYKKSLEGKDRQIFERKQAVKDAIASGKPVPTELRNEGAAFTKELQYDEAQEDPTSHIDDEYARAGVYDPKVLVTTSRDPSSRLQQFAKEMRLVFPNSQRINRGGHVMKELVDACKANDVTDLIILHEHRGEPDGMIDHGTVSEAFPHLIFNNFTSKLGRRTADILKYLFPVPKEDSKRVMTFSNDNDFISFRHHVFVKTSHKDVQLAEVGPRFEMKLFQIKAGTVDLTDADTEWVLRPYQNTAKKRTQL